MRYAQDGVLRWVELEGHGAAKQERAAAASGVIATPGFAVLNARMMVGLAGTDLTLGVDNVFDKAYRQHLDPTRLLRPGRNLYLRVRRSI